jgi:pyruvate/2-oxoglutarate dehydrogenase complex dihydrolipoamide dehydrogenase (E3) component
MVASARVANLTVRGPEYGVRYKRSSLMLELDTVRKRKRDIVESFRGGSEKRLAAQENLDVIHGRGKFVGERKLEITSTGSSSPGFVGNTRTVTGSKIFLNVGCRPAPLNVKNADKIPHLNSTTIMELAEVPKHLVIIGGGPIGLEFGQMFRRFGAKVSIVQHGPRLLPREDEDVSAAVKHILEEDNIDVYVNATVREISRVPTGLTVVSVALPKKASADEDEVSVKSLTCSHILAAAGRAPNTVELGLESAGVEVDGRGFVKVDDNLETSASCIYSLGDVNSGSPQFTHVSYDDFRILKHNLLDSPNAKPKSTAGRIVPNVTFMDPQIGRVGETVASAKKRWPGRKLAIASMPMTWVARALEVNETRGLMKGMIDKETGEILGFVCVGIEGGEIMVCFPGVHSDEGFADSDV